MKSGWREQRGKGGGTGGVGGGAKEKLLLCFCYLAFYSYFKAFYYLWVLAVDF